MKYSLKDSLMLFLALVLLASCTAEPQNVEACVNGTPSGFLHGLWHGFIAPFTFIISFFADSVAVFDVNNVGGWYIFGFLLGIGAFTKGGSEGAKRARK